MTGSIQKFGLLCLLAAILAGGSACSTVQSYDDQFRSVYSTYRQGEAGAAADAATGDRYEEKFTSNDRLLWTMETAKMLHAANQFEESNRHFERAEEIVRDFEGRAEYNVRAGASQLGSLVTNPAALPYRGTYADRIMINTYKALNYLAQGDLEAARVEIRRSHERQKEALAENEAALEEAKQVGQAKREAVRAVDSALEDAAPVDPAVARAYADFANPFTTLLSGLVALADNDPARAEVDFRLLASLPITNSFVEEEFERIQRFLSGQDPQALAGPRVYVIFENGLGPAKREMRVDLVLPDIGYTGFSFPEVVFQPAEVNALRLAAPAGRALVTEEVASMDQIVATEFRTQMPAMVWRTVSSVLAKEVLAKQLTDEWDAIGLLLGSLYKAVVNRADTRTWKTLGKEFHFASFDYPADGRLRLTLLNHNKNELPATEEVTLPAGDFVLVLARSVNQHDLRVTTRSLR